MESTNDLVREPEAAALAQEWTPDKRTVEMCAKLCDEEAKRRYDNSNEAAAGSRNWGVDTKGAEIVQAHKALSAQSLATAIRALIPEAQP